MAGPNVSANIDQSTKRFDRIDMDHPIQGAPLVDVIALWQNAPERNAVKPQQPLEAEKKPDVTNKWIASEAKPGVDRLSLTSEYRVSEADFKKANPDVDPKQIDTTGVSKRIIAPMRFRNGGELEPVMRENVVTHQVGLSISPMGSFLRNPNLLMPTKKIWPPF